MHNVILVDEVRETATYDRDRIDRSFSWDD
jgi:hypothetical protein